MSETSPAEYNPYESPILKEQAGGDATYHQLLIDEHIAAASLYEDHHSQDKLAKYVLQRDAVLIYEEYINRNPNQPPISD